MNNQFWDYLLSIATAIEENSEANQDLFGQLSAQLDGIELLYHRKFDPVDAYEEFVTVTLCRAIAKTLSRR